MIFDVRIAGTHRAAGQEAKFRECDFTRLGEPPGTLRRRKTSVMGLKREAEQKKAEGNPPPS